MADKIAPFLHPCHGELCGDVTVPPEIGSLVHIDVDEEANEDCWKTFSDHPGEEQTVQSQIKISCHVHCTSEHFHCHIIGS